MSYDRALHCTSVSTATRTRNSDCDEFSYETFLYSIARFYIEQ